MLKLLLSLIFIIIFIQIDIRAQTVPVTFECNMAVQICETNFYPAEDSLLVMGSFNSWSGSLMAPTSDSIYSVTLDLYADSIYYFKFYTTHGYGYWEHDPNREILVPPGGTTFSDYFDRDSVCNYMPAPVTFNCNMAVQICETNFDPVVDSVYLRGEFNGWSEDDPMEPVSDSIWSLTLDLEPGYSYQFKFYNSHNGGIWEIGDNREVYVPLNGTIFYDYFNYDTICNPLPVELSSFKAIGIGNEVTLNWVTATEINNKGFEIERKETGERSKPAGGEVSPEGGKSEWANIGFINGNGTTSKLSSYSFTDKNLLPGKYQYRLKQIDLDGSFEYTKVIEVILNTPGEFSLAQNYPNPFNPVTNLSFVIGHSSFITLKVYDMLGNEIETLVNEEKPAGTYTVQFDGGKISSGIYFYKLKAGTFTATKKLILLK